MKFSPIGCSAFDSMPLEPPNEIAAIESTGIAESKLFERMRMLNALISNNWPASLSPPLVRMLTDAPILGAIGGAGVTAAGLLAGCFVAGRGRGFLLF